MPALTIQIKCEKCQAEFLFDVPEPDIVNGKHTGALVWHTELAYCSSCGQAHKYILIGLESVVPLFHIVAVKDPGTNLIVTPGSSIPS